MAFNFEAAIGTLTKAHTEADKWMEKLTTSLKNGGMGIEESMRMQKEMQRFTTMQKAMTNFMKASSDAQKAAVQNMK